MPPLGITECMCIANPSVLHVMDGSRLSSIVYIAGIAVKTHRGALWALFLATLATYVRHLGAIWVPYGAHVAPKMAQVSPNASQRAPNLRFPCICMHMQALATPVEARAGGPYHGGGAMRAWGPGHIYIYIYETLDPPPWTAAMLITVLIHC